MSQSICGLYAANSGSVNQRSQILRGLLLIDWDRRQSCLKPGDGLLQSVHGRILGTACVVTGHAFCYLSDIDP